MKNTGYPRAAHRGFAPHCRSGRVVLHHGHIRPVLIRDWSTPMNDITATIWASQATTRHGQPERDQATRQMVASADNEESS